MTPFVADRDFTLYVGDVESVLRDLPDESVHCVVTSPPYWGLRDYGTGSWEGGDPECDHRGSGSSAGPQSVTTNPGHVPGAPNRGGEPHLCVCGARRVDQQIGLEPTPEEYVARMVGVFREVRRVLRRDGTCWLNIGDSYNSRPGGEQGSSGDRASRSFTANQRSFRPGSGRADGIVDDRAQRNRDGVSAPGLKPKDLVGIPWMLAFALRADGWYLRAEVIWSKPNPMPESVTDRPTKAHEQLFLLTREPRYFYDDVAIREAFDVRPQQRLTATKDQPLGAARVAAGVQQGNPQGGTHVSRFDVQAETLDGSSGESPRGPDGRSQTHVTARDGSEQHRDGERWPNGGRNKRSVWEIATAPYKEAHFAVFPPALVEPCVKAGTSERGVCPHCGAPWVRVIEGGEGTYAKRKELGYDQPMNVKPGVHGGGHSGIHPPGMDRDLTPTARETVGWRETCDCSEPNGYGLTRDDGRFVSAPVPAVVLDPFMGSGTTALVSRNLGRCSVGIELNPEYAALAAKRLSQLSLLAEEIA